MPGFELTKTCLGKPLVATSFNKNFHFVCRLIMVKRAVSDSPKVAEKILQQRADDDCRGLRSKRATAERDDRPALVGGE